MYKEIQNGAEKVKYEEVLLIYVEMRKYLAIYEEAVSHMLVWFCNCSILNFLMHEENLIFFIGVASTILKYFPHFFYLCNAILRTSSSLYCISLHQRCFRRIFCMKFEYYIELWKSWIYMEMILRSLRTGVLYTVHPQNVRFQNVRFQNVGFQNVRFQNVRFTKRKVTKRQVSKRLVSKRPVLKFDILIKQKVFVFVIFTSY